jgi:hypothetical protein
MALAIAVMAELVKLVSRQHIKLGSRDIIFPSDLVRCDIQEDYCEIHGPAHQGSICWAGLDLTYKAHAAG